MWQAVKKAFAKALEKLRHEREFHHGWRKRLLYWRFPVDVLLDLFLGKWPKPPNGIWKGPAMVAGWLVFVIYVAWMFLPLWLPAALAIRYVAAHLTLGWK